MDTVICTPDPCLMESMRSVGYDLSTAIADIVDNSIAANAKHITILFSNAGEEPYIAIIDDGNGMDQEVVPEKLRTLDRGRPWRDSQFASTRLSPSRDMSR